LEPCNYTDLRVLQDGILQLIAQNEKLKALASLGAEQVLSHHGSSPKDEEIKKLKNDLRLCAEGLIPSDLIQRGIVETCREKVKKLEEENKQLKEQMKDLCDEEGAKDVWNLVDADELEKAKEDFEEEKNAIYMNEMMPLETQVEEYEEMTEALAEYFSKIDQNACDVFNKLLPTWAHCRAEMD